MVYIKKIFSCLMLVILVSSSFGCAMNLLKPYDTLIRPPFNDGDRYDVHFFFEKGVGTKSFNSEGIVGDPLRIWQCDFDSLAMLQGFPLGSSKTQLLNSLDANDDGTRGHFSVSSDLDLHAATAFCSRWFFYPDWFLSAFLPVYSMSLKHITFTDLTQNNNASDFRVKDLLTNNIVANIKKLDPSFDLSPWRRTGFGDIALLLNWFHDFPQAKEFLQNARVNWRIGLSIPTGKRRDEDKIFALPFGYDGSFAIPFGMGLDLTYGNYLKAGFDIELTQVFGDTRDRRIKTAADQSEIILLQKAQAYKDFGLTQRFNLYFQLYKIVKGFSFLTGYQFLKHGNDVLSLSYNGCSENIANTALSLQDYTMHHVILDASYDFCDDDWRARPYCSVFARLPFNGKRSVLNRTVGILLGVTF